MYTLTVRKIYKDTVLADNSKVICIEADIFDGETVVSEKKFSYPYGTTEKEIKADLKKALATFELEVVQKENQEKVDKEEEGVDKIIGKVENLSL